MASIKDTAATAALNEEEYINKLYDTGLSKQNQVIQQGFGNDNAVLDQQQEQMQQQTDAYTDRTAVEAEKARDLYGGDVTAGARMQENLTRENALRRNTGALRDAQADADAEYQRRRQLLASQYETAIRQAQADNDMARAQALYDAAKAEEAQLLELQKQGAEMMAGKGDDSILEDIANGVLPERDTTGESWEQTMRNEEALNAIYDAQLESLMAQLQGENEAGVSDLEAQRQARERQTDEKLTQSYVEAMKDRRSSAETGSAYGQGSGTAAGQQLAGDISLQDALTQIRRGQLDSEAQTGLQALELSGRYGRGQQEALSETERRRIQALYDAAEQEEQNLIANQLFVGEQMAEDRDYSILGKLFGLTPDQIDRLQGTGKYARVLTPSALNSKPAMGAEEEYKDRFDWDDEKMILGTLKR